MKLNAAYIIGIVVILSWPFILLKVLEDDKERMTNSAHAAQPSVLYCIASGSIENRLDSIETLLDHALDWCEGGFSVKVIIDTNEDPKIDWPALSQELNDNHVCLTSVLTISIITHPVSINSHELVVFHRKHFERHLHDHDLFVFGEDDMEIRLATLKKWIEQTARLHTLNSHAIVGLMRYENAIATLRKGPKSSFKGLRAMPSITMTESTSSSHAIPMNRITWDMPSNRFILANRTTFSALASTILPDNDYVLFRGDAANLSFPYAAAGIFTRQHLITLESRCNFMSKQDIMYGWLESGRPFYTSYQPFTCGPQVIYYHANSSSKVSIKTTVDIRESYCCMEWIFPIRHFESLLLHHLGSPGSQLADGKWIVIPRIFNAMFVRSWRALFNDMLKNAQTV